jgi:hypothetical protein
LQRQQKEDRIRASGQMQRRAIGKPLQVAKCSGFPMACGGFIAPAMGWQSAVQLPRTGPVASGATGLP